MFLPYPRSHTGPDWILQPVGLDKLLIGLNIIPVDDQKLGVQTLVKIKIPLCPTESSVQLGPKALAMKVRIK